MKNERMQAIGKVELLKKELVKIGMEAGSHLQTINISFNTMLSGKDWNEIDFDKMEILTSELKNLQKERVEIESNLIQLKETYGID